MNVIEEIEEFIAYAEESGVTIGCFVLGPLTMEKFKSEICPKSKHLSDIIHVRFRGIDVGAHLGFEENRVGWSEADIDDVIG